MLKLVKVAITGGLSCGKSSVCRFFKQLGAHVVSADEVVHQLLSPETNLGKKIIHLLGPDIISNSKFDRAKIAQRVFHNPELLRSYEHLLHPAVQEEIERQYQLVKAVQSTPLFIAEIPLLFETGGDGLFDATIVVVAEQESCKKRFSEATHYEPQEYDRRMARQMSLEEKARKATIVIKNNGTMDDLKAVVTKIYHQLTF